MSIEAQEIQERRDHLMTAVREGVILVRGEGTEGQVSPNFYYLTGLAEPRGVLLLFPQGAWVRQARMPNSDYMRGREIRSAMFLAPSDPIKRQWGEDGVATLDSETAKGLGVDALLSLNDLPAVLIAALEQQSSGPSVLNIVRGQPQSWGKPSSDAAYVDQLMQNMVGVSVCDVTSKVTHLRMVKSDAEIEAIRAAAAVTTEAFSVIREMAKPGMQEHQVEAEIARVYRSYGAVHAFGPIVASGARANILHYRSNDAEIREGQLLLVDSGASLNGYASDVTRTWLPGGSASDRQQEVLDAVLASQEAAIKKCIPGVLIDDVHRAAHEVLTAKGFGDVFPHGTSHHLGLETHDPFDPHRKLEPGMVITVEPGVYLENEEIGVRIEDDVLITSEGKAEVLTAAIPK